MGWTNSPQRLVLALCIALLLHLPGTSAQQPAPSSIDGAVISGEPYVVSPAETHPNAKALAAEIALTLVTYGPEEGDMDIVARLPPSSAEAAIAAASSLHHPGFSSAGRVVYPQFGGLTDTQASVIVVVEQTLVGPEGQRTETRAIDVRLKIVGGRWQFDRLASNGGDPVARPATLPAEALAVLEHPSISLPDTARWDIYSGRVSPVLLAFMTRMADVEPIGVVTIISGHAWEIFGTDRQSDHSRGRAVDLYRIGDNRIIEDRAIGSLSHRFGAWLSTEPAVARLGAPWRFPEGTAISFADALHQDHFHVAVGGPVQ